LRRWEALEWEVWRGLTYRSAGSSLWNNPNVTNGASLSLGIFIMQAALMFGGGETAERRGFRSRSAPQPGLNSGLPFLPPAG
jgi:hypothetical protein